MKILVDIGHPAHVHFFRQPIAILHSRKHEIIVTSRAKEIALDLLDDLGITHRPLSHNTKSGVIALGGELVGRDIALWRLVRQERPDVMAAIGGIFIAHVGKVTGVPSLVFYDTENAKLQNALTYPLATRVIAPRAYQGWLPKRRAVRYAGYHELSYLHPNRFKADRTIALTNGVADQGDTFFIRVVSWQANHDIGEKGWNTALLERVCEYLSANGKVLISSEQPLSDSLTRYRYKGDITAVHHVMAHCRGFVGESATMASECAVLGVPAIYAAHTGRGYTDEQESRYGLVRNIRHLDWQTLESAIRAMLATTSEQYQKKRDQLLDDTIDVAEFAADFIEQFPFSQREHRPSLST